VRSRQRSAELEAQLAEVDKELASLRRWLKLNQLR
jgi:ribosomal protein L29